MNFNLFMCKIHTSFVFWLQQSGGQVGNEILVVFLTLLVIYMRTIFIIFLLFFFYLNLVLFFCDLTNNFIKILKFCLWVPNQCHKKISKSKFKYHFKWNLRFILFLKKKLKKLNWKNFYREIPKVFPRVFLSNIEKKKRN